MPPLLKLTSFKTLINPHFLRRSTPATACTSPATSIKALTPRGALSAHDKAVKLGFCRLTSCCKREVDSTADMSVIEENDCSETANLSVNGVVEVSKQAVSKHQSTKLLTLPTVLTIARVVAVPVLICSKLRICLAFRVSELV